MSKIKLTGHASGSGVLTIAAPNTDSDRTITLPDVTGTLLDSGSDLPAANLTGDLPAISGANLTGVGVAGISSSADATAITIDSSENVGIGASPSGGKLVITGTGAPQLKLTEDGEPKFQITLSGTTATLEAASGGSESTAIAFKTSSSGTEAEAMRIDSSGTVLINGTTSPAVRTGGNNSTGDCVITAPALGDNALTLKAPTSHAAGVGIDIVGLNFAANNYYGGSGKSGIYYQIMCENGNGNYSDRGQLRFTPGYDGSIASGQLSNSIVFTYDGNVHIPKSTDGSLSVGTTTAASVLNVNSTEGGSYAVTINCTRNSGSSGHIIDFHENSFGGNRVGTITSSGSSTSYNTSSDYRLKENVVDMENATDRVKQLKPKRFNFIADDTTTVDGFIAHEVSSVVPEAISGEKDAMTAEVLYVEGDDIPKGKKVGDVKKASVPDMQGIDQSKLVPLLVKAMQEQQEVIESLTARITTLEG